MTVNSVSPANSLAAAPDESRITRQTSQILTYLLAALLLFTIVAFGGTHDGAIAVFELAAGMLVVLWACSALLPGQRSLYLNWSPLYPFLFAFAFLVGCQIVFGVSVYRFASKIEGLRYVAYGFVFMLVQQLLGRPSRLYRFLAILGWSGFLIAVEAIAQDFTAKGAIYWHWARPEAGTIYGPYVNHSHYAGLMEMLWPIPAIFAMREFGAKRGTYAFLALVMASSIVFSRSRGGSIALLFQVAYLVFHIARNRGSRAAWQLASLAVVAAAFFYWAQPAGIFKNFASLALPGNSTVTGHRLDILRDSIRMFKDRPVMGWGLETFPVVYPRFRSFTTALFINEAHNDYVQLLVEMGLAGFVIMLAFISTLYRAGYRRMTPNNLNRDATLIALIGCTGILCHSAVDFNLHITANAAMFYVLCSIATLPISAQTFRRSSVLDIASPEIWAEPVASHGNSLN